MPWDDGIDWGVDDPLYPVDPGDNIDAGGGWNPGSGADDPDNIDAGGGWNPGSGGGIDLSSLTKLFGAAGSSGSSVLSSLAKSLGLTNAKGELDLSGLLSLAALLGGGINSINATDKASGQMKEAADQANQQAKDTIGPAQANYTPYITAGQGAIDKMANFDTSPLGAKFVAAGTPSNLAAQFNSGRGLSLGALARKA